LPASPAAEGSGIFGTWIDDDDGLPAYRYTLDQRVDARAEWTLSDGSVRTDHLFQIGNDRLIGVVDTDGFAQIFLKDRDDVDVDDDGLGHVALSLDAGERVGFSVVAR
jgi:hypothetical protein